MGQRWSVAAPRWRAWLSTWIEPLPLDTTERIRFHPFSVFLLTLTPTMVAFGVYHLSRGHTLMGGLALGLAALLIATRVMLGRLHSGLILYRINALFCAGMLLYLLSVGGSGGSKALWMFLFPLIAFFLLGTREGLLWTVGIFAAAAGLVSGWLGGVRIYPYPGEFVTRFSLMFWIITAIGCWFEYLRQHYRKGMEAERLRLMEEQTRLREEIASRQQVEEEREALIVELQDAVSKVRMLRGLLPICSSCKKIRDDSGLWVQIETFVRERSEAEFSHSICPDCGDQMYPGLFPRE